MEFGVSTLGLLVRVGNCMLLKFKRSLHTSILACRFNSLDNDRSTNFIRLMLILVWPPAINSFLWVLGTLDQVSKLRLILWCPDFLLDHHQVCNDLVLSPGGSTKLTFYRFYSVLRMLSLMLISWVNALQIFTVYTTSSLSFKIRGDNLSSRLQRFFEELRLSGRF